MGEWRTVPLGEVADVVMGLSPKGETYNQDGRGIPLLNGPTDFGPQHPHAALYTTDPARFAEPGDLLFCVRGSTTGRMNWADRQYAIGRGIAAIRAKTNDRKDTFFVYGCICDSMKRLLSFTSGSVFPNLSTGDIRAFEIPWPEDTIRTRIAHILGTLEDKIELNRRMNRTLEKMAAALFKSWFIDFDPVHAKAEDRDPGLPAEIADLFPDSFEESLLGPIPQGWTVGVVGDIAEQTIGGQWGADSQVEGTLPTICLRGCDMEDLRANGFAPNAPIRFVKPNAIRTRLPSERDVLIAASGAGPCGRPLWCSAQIAELYPHPVIYSNFVKRFTTPSLAHAVYLDRFLFRKFNDRTIHDYINGTSVPNLDAAGLLSTCKLLVPPDDVLRAFVDVCRPGFQRLYAKQSVLLARLRDTLLPKLISGETRVAGGNLEMLQNAK